MVKVLGVSAFLKNSFVYYISQISYHYAGLIRSTDPEMLAAVTEMSHYQQCDSMERLNFKNAEEHNSLSSFDWAFTLTNVLFNFGIVKCFCKTCSKLFLIEENWWLSTYWSSKLDCERKEKAKKLKPGFCVYPFHHDLTLQLLSLIEFFRWLSSKVHMFQIRWFCWGRVVSTVFVLCAFKI